MLLNAVAVPATTRVVVSELWVALNQLVNAWNFERKKASGDISCLPDD